MPTIYSQRGIVDQGEVMENLDNLRYEIEEEQSKPDNERDRKKEFKLIYKQFCEGLKLSTGSKLF